MTDSSTVLHLDGAERRLSKGWIKTERTSWVIATVLALVVAFVGMSTAITVGNPAAIWRVVMILGFLGIAALLVWGTIWHPNAAYEHTRYAVNERGMEIRRRRHAFLLWRQVVSVPKQRVQHTDIEQGPLMRRYGICRLVIHTAGTQHATVTLDGIEHEVASEIRDHLIGKRVGSDNGE